MKTLTTLSLLIVTVLFTSCVETQKVIDVAGSVQLSGNYNITSITPMKAGKSTSGVAQTLSFAALDKSISGNAGCNTYFGNYTLDLYSINFGAIGSTKKMCSPEIMTAENGLFKVLEQTGSYNLQDDVLTLYSKNDRSVLLTAKKDRQ